MLVIGLMSGTSLDGVDAVLAELSGEEESELRWRVIASMTWPYDPEFRERIHAAIVDGSARQLCRLNADLGERFAEAAHDVARRAGTAMADVDLIGSHGQTVWHEPPQHDRRGATLQLGCAATIAERCGVPVVSDFRSRDVAAGGEGAPLVPWVDRALFAVDGRARVLLNLGGIGNLTRVPPRDSVEPLLAFDTGPGNALMDAAVELATGGAESFDRDGSMAARGSVDQELLEELLGDEYLQREPPCSTGRERFGRPRVQEIVARAAQAGTPYGEQRSWDDLIATLTAFTAYTAAQAIQRWVMPRGAASVVVSGGGARNPVLMEMLRARLAPLPVEDGSALGVDPDAKEALAFAILAWAHVKQVAAGVPEVTGASGACVLGSFTPA